LRAVSASNLHQISAAAILYAGDYDEMLPFYQNDELLLLALDPAVTTSGVPTDSKQPGELVESLTPYVGGSKAVWFCKLDSCAGTDGVDGFVNHLYTSYIYLARPDGWVFADDDKTWPLISSVDNLRPPGRLFFEAVWDPGNGVIRGYWSAPISLGALADGSVHVYPLGGVAKQSPAPAR
jgi:hypothetical protein